MSRWLSVHVPSRDALGNTLVGGWCHTHYNRWMRHGSPEIVLSIHHGLSGTAQYSVWAAMKSRCYNSSDPGYRLYGGRGITMSEEWRADVRNFLRDMGERPSLVHQVDRIDNDGPYSRENCRWATPMEQGRNKRTNHLVTFRKETLPLVVWAERTGLNATMLYKRLNRGWPIEKALTKPSMRGPK